ncbi:Uncharacterised protein [Mycobacteroides abscessus subsp. massiliense]|nr:Uncharacterised protein [Mycobacteroides abscessus subsp. massiliense]
MRDGFRKLQFSKQPVFAFVYKLHPFVSGPVISTDHSFVKRLRFDCSLCAPALQLLNIRRFLRFLPDDFSDALIIKRSFFTDRIVTPVHSVMNLSVLFFIKSDMDTDSLLIGYHRADPYDIL